MFGNWPPTMNSCADLKEKLRSGRRVAPGDAVRLFDRFPLAELGAFAQAARFARHPGRRVTFVVDSNPNYTNVCVARCPFCAFSRPPGREGGYVLTPEQAAGKAESARAAGATTLLLQGGLNPDLPFSYYLELVEALKRAAPGMHLHLFSAPEIQLMAKVSGLSLESVLRELWKGGLRTIPGGGAEILSDRVRALLAPGPGRPKGTVREWVEVHGAAHRLGFRSTATMMYGHVEDSEDVAAHLETLRKLQDETGGFTAFIPWSFKPANSSLPGNPLRSGPSAYLRHLALARIYLDNFDHIQASWFPEGKGAGQAALHFGADDFGGTLIEENVHKESGFVNRATAEEVGELIREAGFEPVQRDTLYREIKGR